MDSTQKINAYAKSGDQLVTRIIDAWFRDEFNDQKNIELLWNAEVSKIVAYFTPLVRQKLRTFSKPETLGWVIAQAPAGFDEGNVVHQGKILEEWIFFRGTSVEDILRYDRTLFTRCSNQEGLVLLQEMALLTILAAISDIFNQSYWQLLKQRIY